MNPDTVNLDAVHDTPTRTHTVRKRRSQLVAHGHHGVAHARHSSGDIDDTFDAVLDQFSRSHRAISGLAAVASQDDHDASLTSDVADKAETSLSAEVMASRPQRTGFAGLLLELWLWLQFSVVVMVFLWAMARRGPKSVLEDAERRRGVVVRRSA